MWLQMVKLLVEIALMCNWCFLLMTIQEYKQFVIHKIPIKIEIHEILWKLLKFKIKKKTYRIFKKNQKKSKIWYK